MTTTLTAPQLAQALVGDAPATPGGGRQRRFDVRRTAAIGLPALTGALLVAATATDPGTGSEAETEMIRVYADNVDLLQWHMTFLHWSYGLWGLIPLAIVGLARLRGRTLMNLAVVLGALLTMSMPALMISDMFFAAIANHVDVATSDAIGKEIQAQQWALKTYLLPGLPSMLLALPIAFAALVRAGRARWWAIPMALLPLPVFVASGTTLWGAAVAGAMFVGLSVVVAKAFRA